MNTEDNILNKIDEGLAKYTVKDSVFTDLFKDKKYTLMLYKALHNEDNDVTEDDIKPITLENVLMENMYNDLGFSVKNKIFILTEAQSTWSVNIIIRMLMYLAETYHNYYMETNQTLYTSKKVDFPKPELYMIYTGERGNKKDFISLTEEFLGGEESSVEVKVKVIFDGKKGDIINQFVEFTKVYNEQVKLYGRTRKAVIETIRICRDRNILKDYLAEREKEVVNIMMSLFDVGYNLKVYGDNIAKEAEEKGKLEGRLEGIKSMAKMCKEFNVSISDTIKRISSEFGLSETEAEEKVKKIWN